MIIFKDLFSEDELFTDTFKYKLVDDIYYHIEGKFIQQSETGDYDIGANPSAEEADEGTEASVTTGIDVALANRLIEMSTTKAQYKKDIKVYVKKLLAKVAETDSKRADFLKNNLPKVITEWIKEYDNMTAFKGESMSVDGTYVLCKYPEGDCNIGCKIDVYVLKDGLVEEKV
ncbi:translationally-controlled tumor protein homolog [Rhopilema esculentum]|uniref:translationally-controlled tumor protein homolog n=1 Tax=Rhopilema esculentum TaxID=499914 RepID=UPI0031D331C4